MNLKCRLILEDYRKQRDDFVKLGDTVHSMLTEIVKELGLTVLAVEHRVKEEKSLAERRKAKEAKAERLKSYIADALGGSAFETARVKCSFRKSTAVNITDNVTLLWYLKSMSLDKCVKHKDPEVVKSEVAKLLKDGRDIPGAVLEERNNMTIK